MSSFDLSTISDLDATDLPTDRFPFAHLRLVLSVQRDVTSADADAAAEPVAQLVAIETTQLMFMPKEIFLELRNCVDAATSSLNAVGFNVSVARMRKKLFLKDKIVLNIDGPVFDRRNTKMLHADFAKLFERRGVRRHYVASGYATTRLTSHSSSTADETSSGFSEDYSPSLDTQIQEISMCFLADEMVNVFFFNSVIYSLLF